MTFILLSSISGLLQAGRSSQRGNEFSMKDQERLAAYLLNWCKAKFMLVIKNTSTILHLYERRGLTIRTFDKKYLVSFQDWNDRNAKHLIITNYSCEDVGLPNEQTSGTNDGDESGRLGIRTPDLLRVKQPL
jgi:hypothetical protein